MSDPRPGVDAADGAEPASASPAAGHVPIGDGSASAEPSAVVPVSPAPAAAPEGAAPTIDRGRSAALTAIGQVFVLVGASLIGVVVAATLSPGARLDAYFTANQLTVAALYVGQALRTSVPGLATGGVVGIPVLARAAALMTGAVAAVLLLGVLLGPLLVPDASGAAMRTDLLILLPGAVLQVGAGYAAGRLAMGGRFAGAALAYASGTLVNAVLLLALIGGGEAGVLAPAALVGWLTSALAIGWLLWRMTRQRAADGASAAADADAGSAVSRPAEPSVGIPRPQAANSDVQPPVASAHAPSVEIPRPPAADSDVQPTGPTGAGEPVGVLGASGRITLSVLPVLAAQLALVAAVTAASHVRDGGATIVSLAFLAVNAVGTIAVAPIPIVLSADLGSTWDRRTETLLPLMMSVVRLSVAVTMPLVLGLFLIGQPLADLALGGLSPADVDDLFAVVLVLLPSLPLTAASMVALVAVFALDRLGLVGRYVIAAAALAVGSIVLATVLGASLIVLAIVASVWSGALGAATIAAALGTATLRAVVAVAGQTILVAAPAAVVLAAALVTGTADGLPAGLAWLVAGGLAHLAWLKLRYPAELNVLLGVVRR